MNDSLEIFTLGSLQIKRNGEPLPAFPTRKVDALLVYLACTAQSHPREALAMMFWDGRSRQQAMANLRATLSRLGHQLEPFLDITRQTVGIKPKSAVWVDAVQLMYILREAQSASQLERALLLYQGDFLGEFYVPESRGFENWRLTERTRLRKLMIEALSGLIDDFVRQGDTTSGITWTVRLLQLAPLDEGAHRQMMLLLATSGERTAALAQYEICRRLLKEKVGVKPDGETSALYRKIQLGDIAAR